MKSPPALAIAALFSMIASSASAEKAAEFQPTFENAAEALRQGATSNSVYQKTEARDLRLWVFQPEGQAPETGRPAIVFIHGGSWQKGGGSAFAPQAVYFASRGMVAITIEYRLIGRDGIAGPQQCLDDATAAMRWVREHAAELGIDPQRIVAAGGSAGGHLAASLALGAEDARPAALVLFNPVYDLVDGWPEGAKLARAAGLDPAEFSPARHVGADFPPTLVLAGSEDPISPPAIHQAFVKRMKAAGRDAEFVEYPGQTHGFFNFGKDDSEYFYRCMREADKFLAKLGFLNGEPTVGAPEVSGLRATFEKAANKPWRAVFEDGGSADWHEGWFLDGETATVVNGPDGMTFASGPEVRNEDNAVLWTKKSFRAPVKVEFDYTRVDSLDRHVNILYLLAEGTGTEGHPRDIAAWAEARKSPAMALYYLHMNLLHISFAAFGNEADGPDYVRARRYPAAEPKKFEKETALSGDWTNTELFKTGVTYHITAIVIEDDLLFSVTGDGQDRVFGWDLRKFPPVMEGRIGLRHMHRRAARYANFTVSELQKSKQQ